MGVGLNWMFNSSQFQEFQVCWFLAGHNWKFKVRKRSNWLEDNSFLLDTFDVSGSDYFGIHRLRFGSVQN